MSIDTPGHEHVLDNFNDALLLTSGQFGSVVEDLSEFARGSAASRLWSVTANEEVGAHLEEVGKNGELLGTDGGGLSFPERISAMGDAKLFGDLRLGEPGLFAQLIKSLTEGSAWSVRGTACSHACIIGGV